jgi:Leucine-rich repeat (LRR) protein
MLLASALVSCGNLDQYDITLNDRTLHMPRDLFKDYYLPDIALSNCVTQAIEDRQVFNAGGLEVLNCSEAGIQSLSGLSRFSRLKRLKLANNDILNLVELSRLTQLEELHLDGNKIVDIVPLTALPILGQVSLSKNPGLQCHGLVRFRDGVEVVEPEHCSL